jgi:hypothetical protein
MPPEHEVAGSNPAGRIKAGAPGAPAFVAPNDFEAATS